MNVKTSRGLLLASAALTAGVGFCHSARAQDSQQQVHTAPAALEEIVVTARKRAESLQETPISITALSAEALERQPGYTIERVASMAPNLSTAKTPNALGAASHFIRGIGASESQFGQDPPVGIYVDDVYYARNNNSLSDLVSPERIEVLRGPQGTLFGRNTTGGAISIVTRTPADEFGGDIRASYGTYNSQSLRLRIDSGLLGNSNIKVSAAYQHRQNDGTVDNGDQPDNKDPGALKSDSFWGKAVGEWGPLNVAVAADYDDMKGSSTYFQIRFASPDVTRFFNLSPSLGGNPYAVTSAPQSSVPHWATGGDQKLKSGGTSLTLTYELSDALTLKSISAYRRFTYDSPSFTGPSNLVGRVGNTLATSVVRSFNGFYMLPARKTSEQQTSEEIQLLGTFGDVQLVVGGFYFTEQGRETTTTNLLVVRPGGQFAIPSLGTVSYRVSNESIAGFAQASWKPAFLEQKLELTGGARYTEDNKDLDQYAPSARSGTLKSNDTSILASVSYRWTPDVMTYARYATGYRAGGFNIRAALGGSLIYLPEKVKSYEAGLKAEFLDRRLRINGAAYYTDYQDLQVGQFIAGGGSNSGNAKATYKGFELEAQAVPIDNLTLSGSVGYTSPKYQRIFFPSPVATATPGVFTNGSLANYGDIAQFQYVPKWTANFILNYSLPATDYGKWGMQVSYAYKGRRHFYTVNIPNVSAYGPLLDSKPYGLLGARLSLSGIPLGHASRAELSVYGENLTDERYVVSSVDFGPTVGIGASLYGERRTFGVEAKVSF
ncbi:TonB-dependent receptor [Phenylobacterium sp.]|uniref:TonB-dependent receptor n=1 Tax=Phenylobacterium sp. TaxID=1871053 RepID=UPI002F42C73D